MTLYEVVFMTRQDLSAAQVDTLCEDYKQIIADNGGAVEKVENWGLRPLAYRINKARKAHYVLMNVSGNGATITEMERRMRLSEDVIRFLTIRVDVHEEGPSAVMRAKAAGEERRVDSPRSGGHYSSGRAAPAAANSETDNSDTNESDAQKAKE